MMFPQRSEVGAGFVGACSSGTGTGRVPITFPKRSEVSVPAGGFAGIGGMLLFSTGVVVTVWVGGGGEMTLPQRSEVGAVEVEAGTSGFGSGRVEMTFPKRSDVSVPAGLRGSNGGMLGERVMGM